MDKGMEGEVSGKEKRWGKKALAQAVDWVLGMLEEDIKVDKRRTHRRKGLLSLSSRSEQSYFEDRKARQDGRVKCVQSARSERYESMFIQPDILEKKKKKVMMKKGEGKRHETWRESHRVDRMRERTGSLFSASEMLPTAPPDRVIDIEQLGMTVHEEQTREFHSRCRHGRSSSVERILGFGIDVDIKDRNGNTPLIIAAQNGHLKICDRLLQAGAWVNAQNGNGNTALHYCYAFSHFEVASFLMQHGADDRIQNAHGLTCYDGITPNRKQTTGQMQSDKDARYRRMAPPKLDTDYMKEATPAEIANRHGTDPGDGEDGEDESGEVEGKRKRKGQEKDESLEILIQSPQTPGPRHLSPEDGKKGRRMLPGAAVSPVNQSPEMCHITFSRSRMKDDEMCR
eukprot:TRINITY_DN180_c0_g5_i1.p1 TRINITY_DN180_c0_g5~~TRINITY_DN180_c0_g5_i1.p1  ORF type:complete len:399 (+),score=122.27 TRINITY_DN180_c0_g5_i1:71-1267(+)